MMNGRYGWILGLSIALGACSTWRNEEPRTYGEKLQYRADMNKESGEKWQSGHDKVQRGKRMVTDGEQMIQEGEREMREAEERARALRQTPAPMPPSSGSSSGSTSTPPPTMPAQ